MTDSTPTPSDIPTLHPDVEAFLQRIDAYAETLPPREAEALRRLVKAGMAANEQTIQAVTDDTGGFTFFALRLAGPYAPAFLSPTPGVVLADVTQPHPSGVFQPFGTGETHHSGVRSVEPWFWR